MSWGVRLVGEKEVCKHLQLPLAALKRMVKLGEVPALKIGGRWRFSIAAVEDRLVEMASRSFYGDLACVPVPAQGLSQSNRDEVPY